MKKRDHALFIAFAPYKNPRYAISMLLLNMEVLEVRGQLLLQKTIIKKVLDRDKLRKKYQTRFISRDLKNGRRQHFH